MIQKPMRDALEKEGTQRDLEHSQPEELDPHPHMRSTQTTEMTPILVVLATYSTRDPLYMAASLLSFRSTHSRMLLPQADPSSSSKCQGPLVLPLTEIFLEALKEEVIKGRGTLARH